MGVWGEVWEGRRGLWVLEGGMEKGFNSGGCGVTEAVGRRVQATQPTPSARPAFEFNGWISASEAREAETSPTPLLPCPHPQSPP